MDTDKIFHCQRCDSKIKVPGLTVIEKEEIKSMMKSSGKLQAIAYLNKNSALDLADSKALILHFNDKGHCVRCNNNDLTGENVICPKCKSFNLNW